MTTTATYNKPAFSGNYPAHWQLLRIKNIFSEIEDRSTDGNEELLSVSHYTGVTRKRDSLENEDDFITNAESLEGYKRVEKGDLVINIMLAWNGSLGISPFDGITSPAYCVYRVKENNNPKYFGYLFSTNLMKAEFRKKSTGIIDSRLRLYSDKFFSIFSVVPPVEEQNQIVEYIKAKSRKINFFIEKKQQFINLLEEQKFSIVNDYCLNGISNAQNIVKLPDDRFDKMPSHWRYIRLKNVLKEKDIRSTTGEEELLSLSKYKGVIPKKQLEERAGLAESLVGYKIVGKGDLVLNKMQASNGLVGVSFLDGITSPDYSIFIPLSDDVLNEYLSYFLKTTKCLSHFYSRAKGVMAGYIRLYSDQLLDIKVPLPPIEEQIEIIEKIKFETQAISTAISKAEKEIELIKEYKEAMIAEAVMGNIKINVNAN
ncbi:MAG: restriction endonuclease subunit S [Bacteroidetes bacterium]|nr:restriction endonuclease subunit S [Bacteroidota bacterium]